MIYRNLKLHMFVFVLVAITCGGCRSNKDIVVGKGAVIMATSALDKSVEGGKVYMGSPAMEVKKYWRYMVSLKQIPELIKNMNSLLNICFWHSPAYEMLSIKVRYPFGGLQ